MAGAPPSPALTPEEVERFSADPAGLFRRNLAAVEARIAAACARAGRDPAEVRLLPISKTVPAPILRFAVEAGIRSFGENKIQEAAAKAEALADLGASWSVVGHLQTNKAKALVRFAAAFQALDSLRLAEILDRRLAEEGRDLEVYVQVNSSGEASKFGLPPEALPDFLDRLQDFPRLKPRGLMTLALLSADPAQVKPCFQLMRRLRDESLARHPEAAALSMGMSGDFELAIEEGANLVRVGQAIFGARPTPDSLYWPGATS